VTGKPEFELLSKCFCLDMRRTHWLVQVLRGLNLGKGFGAMDSSAYGTELETF
jgi:hypothetical protein